MQTGSKIKNAPNMKKEEKFKHEQKMEKNWTRMLPKHSTPY